MWFWYALASAFLVGLSIAVSKRALVDINTSLVTWALFTLSLPVLLIIALWNGVPKATPLFYGGAVLSGFVFVFSKLIELRAVKESALASVYPLTTFSTIFTYILGVMLLSEHVRTIALIGLFITLFGAYLLNIAKAKEGVWQPLITLLREPSSSRILLAMVFAAFSSIFDKTALLNIENGNPAFTLIVENIVMATLLTGYLSQRHTGWTKTLKKNFGMLLLMSLIYAAGGIATFKAFAMGPIALASAVKRTQVLWVFLFGILFFAERPSRNAWFATLLMLAGVVLMKLEL